MKLGSNIIMSFIAKAIENLQISKKSITLIKQCFSINYVRVYIRLG